MATINLDFGFFDNNNDGRVYSATDFSRYLEGLVTNGCLFLDRADVEGFKVIPNTASMGSYPSVKIAPGKAYYDGYWVYNESEQVYTFDDRAQTEGYYRHVYLCFDLGARKVEVQHVSTTSATPYWPPPTASLFYLPLATVTDRVPTNVNPDVISDTRIGAGVVAAIENDSITAALLHPDLKGNAATSVEALRKIGTAATDAAAGNHTHLNTTPYRLARTVRSSDVTVANKITDVFGISLDKAARKYQDGLLVVKAQIAAQYIGTATHSEATIDIRNGGAYSDYTYQSSPAGQLISRNFEAQGNAVGNPLVWVPIDCSIFLSKDVTTYDMKISLRAVGSMTVKGDASGIEGSTVEWWFHPGLNSSGTY